MKHNFKKSIIIFPMLIMASSCEISMTTSGAGQTSNTSFVSNTSETSPNSSFSFSSTSTTTVIDDITDKFKFRLTDSQDGYKLLEYIGNDTDVVVPKEYKGLPVLEISNYAFAYCSSLTSIVIPDSVTSIGFGSFVGCSSLTSIVIPNSVTTIGSSAFSGCSYLESITLPFVGASRNATEEEALFGYIFGDSSYTGGVKTEQYYSLSSYITYYIPSSLKEVIITDATSIGFGSFVGCSSLTSIVIPNSVTSIGEYAFYQCYSLISIVIPNSVTSIGDYAFSNCSSLTSIVIPDSVTSIGDGAFWSCSSLTSIVIPDSVTTIGSSAFSGCSSLTIYCEASSQPSGWYSDWNNYSGSVYWGVMQGDTIIQNGIQYLIIDGNAVVTGHTDELPNQVVIPTFIMVDGTNYSVTSIGYRAFSGCSSLTSIVIPDSVTSIGDFAFSYCSSLQYNEYGNCYYLGNEDNPYLVLVKAKNTSITEATISNDTRFIMDYALENCSSLTSVTFESGSKLTSIGYSAFSHCSFLTSIVIPNSVTSIGKSAFSDCDSLTSIIIPNSVTSIGYAAFSSCSSLTSIVIPDSVTSIGDRAFRDCSSLTSVTFESGSKLTSIGSYAFSGCSSLTSIVIPDSVTSIGEYAFNNCSKLTSIVIPDSVTSIGSHAFENCSLLTSIVIPNSVTSIGKRAFYNCSYLTIYCEASSQLSGWDSEWNYYRIPVYWGGEWSYVDGVPTPNK